MGVHKNLNTSWETCCTYIQRYLYKTVIPLYPLAVGSFHGISVGRVMGARAPQKTVVYCTARHRWASAAAGPRGVAQETREPLSIMFHQPPVLFLDTQCMVSLRTFTVPIKIHKIRNKTRSISDWSTRFFCRSHQDHELFMNHPCHEEVGSSHNVPKKRCRPRIRKIY